MEKVPYQKMSFYPNVREAETVIWDRFLLEHPDAYDSVVYNLKIGEGAYIPPDTPANIADDFKQLTQHKIDVVGFKGNQIDIIELKQYAGVTAIGQVIGYRDLYIHHIDSASDPHMVIITDTLRPDTKTIAEKQGITVIVA